MEPSQYPFVSVIILNYNGKHHLKTCLDSVLKTDYPNFEVILVDNGSTDGSIEFVKSNYPNVKIIKLKKNYGTAIGYDVGVMNAKGKYVAILNNDIEVNVKWLKMLVKYVKKFRKLNVVAADPKFRSFYSRDKFEDSAAAGRWIDYFGNNYTRGVNEKDVGQYDKPIFIFGILTFFERDALIKSGAFDPYYIFGYEDNDLGWRLYLLGYKVIYVPDSVIYHKSGGTTRGLKKRPKPFFYYFVKKNKIVSLLKNYEIKNMLPALMVTLFEYSLLIYYFMLTNQKEYGYGVFRAIYKTLFKDLKHIIRRRIRVQALRKVRDKDIKKYMVPYSGILWDLVKGRR